MRTLHPFPGGVQPPEHKHESNQTPIQPVPLPRRLGVYLRQHLGAPAKPVAAPGERVLKGQTIAAPDGNVSAAVHAPTSGRVLAIEPAPFPHPSGLAENTIVIEPDGEERWIARTPLDWRQGPREAILQRLRESGIVGLGGAVFPTHVKFSVAPGSIETLILNGAECEPWLTSDDRLMQERADAIARGIAILRHLAAPGETLVAIEDNKPAAIAAMQRALAGSGVEVVVVPTRYPTGSEKQLIHLLTGKEVPSGGRPHQVGVLCSNVATAYAVQRAVECGEPLIARIVTVTGNVAAPGNFEALIGTPLEDLLRLAGGGGAGTRGYLMGGPMMGIPLAHSGYYASKGSNGFIAVSDALFPPPPPPMPCTRCIECVSACPVSLRPHDLYWFIRGKNYDKAQGYGLADCIECGCCSYVCPSHIPLVQYFRHGKGELAERARERHFAELSRQRSEARQQRLEREKAEKAARLAEAAKKASPADEAAKKAAIAAAMARVAAQKAERQAKETAP